MTGIGYREELAAWISSHPPGISCLEITAEHFYRGDLARLSELADSFPLFVHGLGLSLGTPGPLDSEQLNQFVRVAEAARARWVSEHIAFTRTEEVDLGHLNPVPPTRESLKTMVAHAKEVAERCGRRLLLENITSHVQLRGELSETELISELFTQADCGLLLDVTNLYVNSRNHGFDPIEWLHRIEPASIQQLHIVGYSRQGGRLTDDHSQPVQDELLELARAVIAYAPVQAIILERDADFPGPEAMQLEIEKIERLLEPA